MDRYLYSFTPTQGEKHRLQIKKINNEWGKVSEILKDESKKTQIILVHFMVIRVSKCIQTSKEKLGDFLNINIEVQH